MEQPVQPAPPGPVPDRETDLHYNTFRHCDPAVGRYADGSVRAGERAEHRYLFRWFAGTGGAAGVNV